MDPHEVAVSGIARTFQNIALFKGMTVLDNIMTGRNLRMRAGILAAGAAHRPGASARRSRTAKQVERIIDFLEIQAYRKTQVGPAAVRPAEARRPRRARSPRSRACCCSTSRWPA